MLKNLLNSPSIYQSFQQAGGFFGARVKAMAEFLDLKPGMRVIDIGCGPGYIAKHMPKGVDYVGFDIDPNYIKHANEKFGDRGRFFCRLFDARAAREFGPVDVVMMNGVLHHISEAGLAQMLPDIRCVLRPGGVLFTLDGCYVPNQTRFRKWMLDKDRGEFVRDAAGYRTVLDQAFDRVELHIRENYARVPYTFVVGLAHRL